ncbi:Uncharacterised protein [BD1-7 clade bacterium]|uniref:Endonuclease/exonuclease/phosphatase domain-containing protein n=1 Tax=BD1-7 clade bacterium TaxID=2029982 RepID=A0A5S9R1X0_9GAMM|nr:Uncharacterised protein [BD1-7 clade bacterium]
MTVKPATFRVCSYNIHKGFSASNRRFLLDDMRDAIRSVNADLCFLQEVRGEDLHPDTVRESNQFEFLADSVWPHSAYGHNAIYQQGHHGNAILSKYPFTRVRNYDVSQWFFSQRGVLLGHTDNDMYLACVHMGLLASERQHQTTALIRLIEEHVPSDAPLIIAGDFNDMRLATDKALKPALSLDEVTSSVFGRTKRTFPSQMPILPMDRIYYRNVECIDASVMTGNPWKKLSDHCALTATFRY